MRGKIRVGVLMDSSTCMPDLYDTLLRLACDESIELHLLQNRHQKKAGLARVSEKIRTVGVLRFISIAFFNCVEYVEKKAFSATSANIRRHFQKKQLDTSIFAGTLDLHPRFSRTGIIVTYSDDDISRIRALDLDLLLRGNGSGIYRGQILCAARRGIISFHHGDNRWNRGGPPGFWEVYLKKPGTGFVIQLLTEELDNGDVIFRGEAPTKRSYTENVVSLYRVANPFMADVIVRFAKTGELPPALPKAPHSHALLRTPKFSITLRYVMRMAALGLSLIVKRKVLGRHLRWSIAFVKSDWNVANLSKAQVVRNPSGRFLADPFVVTRGGDTVIFVEDYDYATAKGQISAVRLLPDSSYEIVPNVISEPFHLSFPFIFEYEHNLYMIPESRESRSIRLYRCTRFPDRWEYVMDLMKDVSAVDSMVFEHGGVWWLLSNIALEHSGEQGTALFAFSAASPLTSEWRPHSGNPVVFSARVGRNGGLLRHSEGRILRVRQRYGYNEYGAGISVATVTQLDCHRYEESTYCEIEPQFLNRLAGTHHMHSDGSITVFDFVREESLR